MILNRCLNRPVNRSRLFRPVHPRKHPLTWDLFSLFKLFKSRRQIDSLFTTPLGVNRG